MKPRQKHNEKKEVQPTEPDLDESGFASETSEQQVTVVLSDFSVFNVGLYLFDILYDV